MPRVLEIVKNRLCWIVGTVYLDMPLKPNVLEDIARDVSIRNYRAASYLLMLSKAFDTSTAPAHQILLTRGQHPA